MNSSKNPLIPDDPHESKEVIKTTARHRTQSHKYSQSNIQPRILVPRLKTSTDEETCKFKINLRRRFRSLENQEDVATVRVTDFPNVFIDEYNQPIARKNQRRTRYGGIDGKTTARKSLNARDMFSYLRHLPITNAMKPHRHQPKKKSQARLPETKTQSLIDMQPVSLRIFLKQPILKPVRKSPSRHDESRHRSGTVQYQEIKTYFENKYETKK